LEVEGVVSGEAGEPVLEGLDAAGDLGGVEFVAAGAQFGFLRSRDHSGFEKPVE